MGVRTVRVQGVVLRAVDAELVTVEARFEPSDRERTEICLSGLPDAVIRESRGRLQCALQESGFRLGPGRLYLNLVPAGTKKHGEILDLPMALGAVAASGHLRPRCVERILFLGEVGIDGRLHAVPGGLAAALAAVRAGVSTVVGPHATASEAACVEGITAHAAASLSEVAAFAAGRRELLPPLAPPGEDLEAARPPGLRLDDIRDQDEGKLAVTVAAAGGHGLLLVGPPGVGKSLLARALVELSPPLSMEDRLEVTRVLSAAGRWPGGLATRRPFRAPHHSVSHAGLVGGGTPPSPGEITLAHCGVLFLDELPEFRRSALEALRQPLESGSITISRAGRQVELPARFQVVCAMNPCPCGFRGCVEPVCRCPPSRVRQYRGRISGPLLDRIDLSVELARPGAAALFAEEAPSSEHDEAKVRIRDARERMAQRQGSVPNGRLSVQQLADHAGVDGDSRKLLERAARRGGLSARGLAAVRRVARTLADLDDSATIEGQHVARALALRVALV